MTSQRTTLPEELLNRAWNDETFRDRLVSDPKDAIAELGARLPDDVDVRVLQDSDQVMYLHIPSPPPEGEITDQDLLSAQGGLISSPICIGAASFVSGLGAATVLATLDDS